MRESAISHPKSICPTAAVVPPTTQPVPGGLTPAQAPEHVRTIRSVCVETQINPLATQTKWEGRLIELNGRLTRIEEDHLVLYDVDDPDPEGGPQRDPWRPVYRSGLAAARCDYGEAEMPTVLRLKRGEAVHLTGRVKSVASTYMQLLDCTFRAPAPTPPATDDVMPHAGSAH